VGVDDRFSGLTGYEMFRSNVYNKIVWENENNIFDKPSFIYGGSSSCLDPI
jgi:hypothetical protein